MVTVAVMTGREALLQAFDGLFDAAAKKLNVVCTTEERSDAREQFATRFATALEIASQVQVDGIPTQLLESMQAAIADLSPAELVAAIASVPLAKQAQEMLRAIEFRRAEQRLIEHFVSQADARYGGN